MGDFCTDAYLTPLIGQVYEDQTTQLMSDTGSSFDDIVIECLGVPIGTTSLSNYQSSQMTNDDGSATLNGPLYGLVSPSIVEWKVGGQPNNRYVEAERTGKLPNVSPAGPPTPFQMWWEWRGSIIYLTPMQQTVDIQVRGEFSPPELVKDTDILVVHPRIATATAYGTAALIGQERNNAPYTTGYFARADQVLENIANMLVKSEQGVTTRIGRLHSNFYQNGWLGQG